MSFLIKKQKHRDQYIAALNLKKEYVKTNVANFSRFTSYTLCVFTYVCVYLHIYTHIYWEKVCNKERMNY